MKVEPQDFIVFTVIVGCTVSIASGHDGAFKDILISVVCYYVGKKSDQIKINKS